MQNHQMDKFARTLNIGWSLSHKAIEIEHGPKPRTKSTVPSNGSTTNHREDSEFPLNSPLSSLSKGMLVGNRFSMIVSLIILSTEDFISRWSP